MRQTQVSADTVVGDAAVEQCLQWPGGDDIRDGLFL